MDFEFTITDAICVERTDFNKMKKLLTASAKCAILSTEVEGTMVIERI